jgi:hypothetical protein
MKLFDPDIFVPLTLALIPIALLGSGALYQEQQNALFQDAYNKNMECRKSVKNLSADIICGKPPQYSDFVNNK